MDHRIKTTAAIKKVPPKTVKATAMMYQVTNQAIVATMATTIAVFALPMAVMVTATTPTTTSIATKLTQISMIGLMLTQCLRIWERAYAEPGTNLNTTHRKISMGLRSRALV